MNNFKWYKYLLNEAESESNKQVILDSIVDKTVFVYYNWDSYDNKWLERPIVVLDTQKGMILAYRSTGTSPSTNPKYQKAAGEWTYFKGFASHPENESFFLYKTPSTIEHGRNDPYLHRIFLALEDLWQEDQMSEQNGFRIIRVGSEIKKYDQKNEVNKKIKEIDSEGKYMFYNNETMFCALINIEFRSMGISEGGTYGFIEDRAIGIYPIKSEKLSKFELVGKFLPALDDNLDPEIY